MDRARRARGSRWPRARCRRIAELPEDVRARLPHGLGDPDALAHRHGRRPRRLHRSEPVAEPLHREPQHRAALVMYFYAWKKGLKTTYYLRSRPATRIAKATVESRPPRDPKRPTATPTPRRRCRRLLAREPRELRGLPVSAVEPPRAPARSGPVPDAAADGLSRVLRDVPRRHQEHLDRRGGRLRHRRRPISQTKMTRRRAPPGAPARRLLRDRRLDRREQPRAQPVQAHQRARSADVPLAPALRRGAARPVLPDAARHLRARSGGARTAPSPRSRTSRRSGRRPSSACAGSIRSRGSSGSRRATQRRQFLLNLICFAACIEGLFFFGAFAYVYFLRSRGLLHGLAAGTNWVFRDESAHMAFAFEVVDTVRREEPELFDAELERGGLAR